MADQRARLGLAAALSTVALTAEASHRQFYRQTTSAGDTLVIMDSPPALERNQAFVDLATVFADAGLPVPNILARDLESGYLLLSDVGDRDLYSAYEAGEQHQALATAIDWLAQLQPVRSPHIPPYSAARLIDELDIFSQWYVQGALTQDSPAARLSDCFDALVASAIDQPQVCVHRDYHCRNLLFGADGQFGIVDFQDALHGPVTYDLASLLRDCYYRLPESVIAHWREVFRARVAPQMAPADFARAMDWMALQRQLKAVGIFARLALRDGKHTHLRHIAPTLSHLASVAARYDALAPLSHWLAEHQALWPAARQRLQDATAQ